MSRGPSVAAGEAVAVPRGEDVRGRAGALLRGLLDEHDSVLALPDHIAPVVRRVVVVAGTVLVPAAD
eukprot:CAMPEP_0197915216 /NCGR_PEP_ID=MMETSP1439-20131203/79839_1 /TAXON_ID=66791 /ORGANISM="Gonyaulax spinifera, Strain CCMP409" /LENGTH=66 /DNA_ID=CAMNT_0043537159 /DNA_START=45 /DNA_END=245 /DNA_ORIENTATION=+